MSNESWKRNLAVPFFSQRENTYVWKQRDSETDLELPDGKHVSMAYCSCNITSLCMILHYFGITEDSPDDMMRKVFEIYFKKWAQEEDNESNGTGTNRLLSAGNMGKVAHTIYGVSADIIKAYYGSVMTPDLSKKYIAAGYPVWFSYGALSHTKSGHIAVLRGFTPEGDVIVNDPWGDAADPYGFLKTDGLPGYYYRAGTGTNMYSWGLGTGDNCIIKKSEFAKIIKNPLHQSLVIAPPKLWDFPVKTGLQKAITDAEEQDAVKACFDRENWSVRLDSEHVMVKNGFPLCENGKWHDGIHIKGSESEPVYPVGPGRLVAVRNAGIPEKKDADSYNFVLIRHNVPGEESSSDTKFYSCYMHLGPVAIRQRLMERFSFASEQQNVHQNENRDWLDQIIDHLLPKKALVYIEGTSTGNDSLSLPVFKKDLISKITTVKDRELVYLCPLDNRNKELLETIDENENSAQLAQLYSMINDSETYTYHTPAGTWYRIFTKVKRAGDEEYEWEDGFVKAADIIPQALNIKEYVYYRRKLVSLLKGETVVFNDEDTDSSAVEKAPVRKERWQSILDKQIRLTFPFVTAGSTSQVAFTAVKNHYEDELISIKGTAGEQKLKEAVWNDIVARLTSLSSALLGYPWQQVDEPFKMKDGWVTQMKDVWGYLYKKMFPEKDGEAGWKIFESEISTYCPRNVDYHIEMNTITPAGTFGRYKGTEQIHVELFSDEPLIKDREVDRSDSWRQIKEKDSSKYFDKKTTVKLFSDAGIFDSSYFSYIANDLIRPFELGKFYSEKQNVVRHILVNHINGYVKKDEAWFKKMMKQIVGFLESNESNEKKLYKDNETSFLDDNVKKELGIKIKNDSSWFYHPVQFVLWLNTRQKNISSGIN
jgi:hypothetical protein